MFCKLHGKDIRQLTDLLAGEPAGRAGGATSLPVRGTCPSGSGSGGRGAGGDGDDAAGPRRTAGSRSLGCGRLSERLGDD